MEFIEKKHSSLDNICIILTSTIYVNPKKNHLCNTDPNNRLEIYLKSVKQWLEKTNFKIVLVENSGYKYPELKEYAETYKDRFEMILFKEDEIKDEVYDDIGAQAVRLPNDYLYTSKGTSEMFAIYYAYQESFLAKTCDFFIKITCRYFIPQLEEFLTGKNMNDYEALKQNDGIDNPEIYKDDKGKCRCEVVGAHKNKFDEIFRPDHFKCSDGLWHHHAESIYRDRMFTRLTSLDKILVCDKFKIEPTLQGGTFELMRYL
jgi:hypothetical protein